MPQRDWYVTVRDAVAGEPWICPGCGTQIEVDITRDLRPYRTVSMDGCPVCGREIGTWEHGEYDQPIGLSPLADAPDPPQPNPLRLQSAIGHGKNARNKLRAIVKALRHGEDIDEDSIQYALEEVETSIDRVETAIVDA